MKTKICIVTTRGRFVVPAEFRRKFGIRKGTRVAFVKENNRLVLHPLSKEYVRLLQGSLRRVTSALDFLLREHRRERELRRG